MMNTHFLMKILIENVRNLKNIEIPLSDTTCKHLILTGKNGSGKTSVLEALATYLSQYMLDINNMESLKWQMEECKRISKRLEDPNLSALERKQLESNLKNYQSFLQQYFQGVVASVQDETSMLAKALDGKFIIAYYKAERQYKASNEKHIEKVTFKNQYGLQEFPGRNFVKYLLDMKSTEALAKTSGREERAAAIGHWFQNFESVLQQIFDDPQLYLDFDIDTYEFKIIEPGKEPFSFDTLSSGYAAVLDIITDLMMRMENKSGKAYDLEGIVLIDEVETHLHLALQKNILPMLTKLFPNIQFIVTTHSPFILNSIANVVIYDLANHTLVQSPEGLSNLPYEGIVDGYFGASRLSSSLKEKYERYKILAAKPSLSDNDYEEIIHLENYLDEIPDYLALSIMSDYTKIKLELANRE